MFREIADAFGAFIAEFIGFKIGTFLFGDLFLASLLAGVVTAPLSAVLVDGLTSRLGIPYGGILYALIALFVAGPLLLGGGLLLLALVSLLG